MRWIFICTFLIPSWAAARTLSAGAGVMKFDYREDLPTPYRSRESGILPFLEGGVDSEIFYDFKLRSSLRAAYRTGTFYEGSSLATAENVSATDSHSMLHVELTVEKPVEFLTAYAGFSYDHWDRFLTYGSGYREIYTWWTLPVGVLVPIQGIAGLAIDAAVLWPIQGTMRVIFSETVTGGDDTTLGLGNRVGFRLRAPYVFTAWERDWTLLPWVQWTAFGASDAKTNSTPGLGGSVREPSSQTLQIGLGLLWNRAF